HCVCPRYTVSALHLTSVFLSLFFFMIRRPPRSTLFPYTRSSDLPGCCRPGSRPPGRPRPCPRSTSVEPMRTDMTPADGASLAKFLHRLQCGLVALAAGWLLWLLAPVLTPFAMAALLGWLGDPLVDRMQSRGVPRNGAVIMVFAVMSAVALLALLLLLPLLQRQVVTLVASLPAYREWIVHTALPWVEARTGLELVSWLAPARLFRLAREHWDQAGGAAATFLGYLSRSGFALLGWVANIVLIP